MGKSKNNSGSELGLIRWKKKTKQKKVAWMGKSGFKRLTVIDFS